MLFVVLALLLAAPVDASASAYADLEGTEIEVGNELVKRTWSRSAFKTTSLTDLRTGREWAAAGPDFSFELNGVPMTSSDFQVASAEQSSLPGGGVKVTLGLESPTVGLTRTIEVYPGVAGFRTQTTIESLGGGVLQRATLERVTAPEALTPAIQAFRAGADWREPDWGGVPSIGDSHAGTWRKETAAGEGEAVKAAGQWISGADGAESLFLVTERNDMPSSRAAYDGLTLSVSADYSRDVLSLGPFEEQGHVENPSEDNPIGRVRTIKPGVPLKLEAVFTGIGSGDGDEGWQFHKYLVDHRTVPYDHDITFNSNGTDHNAISTGAKDDMNEETVAVVAPIARRMGVDTFILDDGWQARSGDWYPDTAEYPEPRWDGDPNSKFRPRFSDPHLQGVRDLIAPMKLGLWMNPTFFHPSAETYKQHPDWICQPVGSGLYAYNSADQTRGSNEAGLSPWNPRAFPHVESRIREMVEVWKVSYFKFDFLVWLDCAGESDLYEFHDAFVAMVDRLQASFPHVTFQIDETNDYRLFPFESVSRGPSWFQNGSPTPSKALHNVWNLSPYVPSFSLGQNALANDDFATYGVDTLFATSLLAHPTFFSDLRDAGKYTDERIDRIGEWAAYYKRNNELFSGVVYPLLYDPMAGRWTALQSWDPEAGRGALLAFRQGDPAASATIALRNVPPNQTFSLREGTDETAFGTFSSQQLSDGIEISLSKNRSKVLLIEATP